jgi:small-conductance mechanosensitive channel
MGLLEIILNGTKIIANSNRTMVEPTNNILNPNEPFGIFQYYYDQFTIFRIFGFIGAVVLTFFLSWFIPAVLQKIFRDLCGLEINFNSNVFKRMLLKYYLRKTKKKYHRDDHNNGNGEKRTDFKFGKRYFTGSALNAEEVNYHSNNNNNNNDYGADNYNNDGNNDNDDDDNDDENDFYVENEYKGYHHGGWGYLRSNFFSIIYLFIRTVIFFVGLFFSFLIIRQDFIATVTSLGIGGFVALMQLAVYFSNFFAHLWILLTSKIKMGDIVTFQGTGMSGMVVEMGVIHTTLISINPNHNFDNDNPHSSLINNNNNNNNNSNFKSKSFKSALPKQQQTFYPTQNIPGLFQQPNFSSASSEYLYMYNLGSHRAPPNHFQQNQDEARIQVDSENSPENMPYKGRFFHHGKRRNDHERLVFDEEIVELHVSNYDCAFSPLYVIHQ